MNTAELRAVFQEMLPLVTASQTSMYLDDRLWQVVKRTSELLADAPLSVLDRRLMNETVLDFKSEGADLPPEGKARLSELNRELSRASQCYKDRTLLGKEAFDIFVTDEAELSGVPAAAIATAKEAAVARKRPDAWRFTLDPPSYSAVMRYADREALRRAIWTGMSSVGTGEYDTEAVVWEILRLRHEKANLLGYPNFSDYIISRRMAKTGRAALDFIETMRDRVDRQFRADEESLRAYVQEKTGEAVTEVFPWNVPYWSERQREELHGFNGEDLRPYFPLEGVLEGLFLITGTILGIRLEETSDAEVYHPDVRVFKVFDKATDQFLGAFYADLYPREGKRDSAWMGDLEYGSPQLCLLATNFQRGFLNHEEVKTIFHEYGHVINQILSSAPYESIWANTPWDFVELQSQLLENWVWERSALNLFARKADTGELIPEELFAKLTGARTYGLARGYMRQLRNAKFDLEVHLNYETHKDKNIDELDRELLVNYRLPSGVNVPSIMRDFSHIFTKPVGYASAYYSYLWSAVLDADVFTVFQKEGVLNAEIGMSLRKNIYDGGTGELVDELFRIFMGRDPDLTAFLTRAKL
jgi:oligopeptidase A